MSQDILDVNTDTIKCDILRGSEARAITIELGGEGNPTSILNLISCTRAKTHTAGSVACGTTAQRCPFGEMRLEEYIDTKK